MKDKLNEIPLLYDFYGKLLTDKQQHYLELYYLYDLSLGEIAEENGTSRQAVYDLIKRSEKLLLSYESKLHLTERFVSEKGILNKMLLTLRAMNDSTATKAEMLAFVENSLLSLNQLD